jgi:hypothetical protein
MTGKQTCSHVSFPASAPDCFIRSYSRESGWIRRLSLKWIPVLTRKSGSVSLWKRLFAVSPLEDKFLDTLLSLCAATWSRVHLLDCTKWLLSGDGEPSSQRAVEFLVTTSARNEPIVSNVSGQAGAGTASNPSWCQSQAYVDAACTLAFASMLTDPSDVSVRSPLPEWISLLIIVGSSGRRQLRRVCQLVLQRLDELTKSARSEVAHNLVELDVTLLRLYLLHSRSMDLALPNIRNVLMKASEKHAGAWVSWHCSVDDEMRDSLASLFGSSDGASAARSARALSDSSRSHPLLVLRSFTRIVSLLRENAAYRSLVTGATGLTTPESGFARGYPLKGYVDARWKGKKPVRMIVGHWGYVYSEHIWSSVLDVVAAVPKEVLFRCGPALGLLDLLLVYAQLMWVQQNLRTTLAGSISETKEELRNDRDRTEMSHHRPAIRKLQVRVSEVLNSFRESNRTAWLKWLGEANDCESEVRLLLLSCDLISAQEAIESVS